MAISWWKIYFLVEDDKGTFFFELFSMAKIMISM